MRYLLRDGAGAFDELPFGEAVGGGDLQGSGLLDEEDASVSELLHSRFNLETNLEDKQHSGLLLRLSEITFVALQLAVEASTIRRPRCLMCANGSCDIDLE